MSGTNTVGVRTSGRKLKRKTFENFVEVFGNASQSKLSKKEDPLEESESPVKQNNDTVDGQGKNLLEVIEGKKFEAVKCSADASDDNLMKKPKASNKDKVLSCADSLISSIGGPTVSNTDAESTKLHREKNGQKEGIKTMCENGAAPGVKWTKPGNGMCSRIRGASKVHIKSSKPVMQPEGSCTSAPGCSTGSNKTLLSAAAGKSPKESCRKPDLIKERFTSRKKQKVEAEKPERIYICRKSRCGKKINRCAVKANDACCDATGYSSRWYHLSLEEHYCNACFEQFYRNKYDGFDEFHEWKRAWMNNSKSDSGFANVSNYISEKQLPYWVKCTRCERWRQLGNEVDLTRDIIKTYVCAMGNMFNTLDDPDDSQQRMPHVKYTCHQKHDPSVDKVLESDSAWMKSLNYTPLLKFSPATPFLTSYYPDGVGMSAVDIDDTRKLISSETNNVSTTCTVHKFVELQRSESAHSRDAGTDSSSKVVEETETSLLVSPGGRKSVNQAPQVSGLNDASVSPFFNPFEQGKALCLRPDIMEPDEAQEFPEYVKNQAIYLAMRNLVIAMWTMHQKAFLTATRCCEYITIRGLTRIHLCELLLPRIMCFAMYKGLINIGALNNPSSGALLPKHFAQKNVIVIGAGPAGLGAARQLQNFGIEVAVLEARDRIGGRVDDDWSLGGVCVGKGAQIVNGCVNNPIALMSRQLDLKTQVLRPRCELYDVAGAAIATNCDKRMEFHFNALLDIIAEWRRNQRGKCDASLGEKIAEAHDEWMKQSGLTFSKLEEELLQFHLGNLEFACGSPLDKVSALHWDQDETFAQFGGDHTFVQCGISTLLEALAQGLNVQLSSPVISVDHAKEGKAAVELRSGKVLRADCVLVTVPLAVLKSKSIRFSPELPLYKQDAMNEIGCGCIEKIGLEFAERFWDDKINNANYFGRVPSGKKNRGFCGMFYDVPTVALGKGKVLMSVISGDAVDVAAEMSEKEIVDVAMSILSKIFPDRSIPELKRYFVTRWRKDPYAQMAYSFVRTNGSCESYDKLAQSVEGKIFFAGEATNRRFPQTVTGAYLSGLREAANIAVCKASVCEEHCI